MKTEVFKDELYEQSMKQRLEQSREKLQNMLDVWNETGLEACESSAQLYELIWNGDVAWQEGIMKLHDQPPGLTPEQEQDHQDRIVEPDPFAFFTAAEVCRQDAYCLREQMAFGVKGKKVILAPGSKKLIKGKSVFADSKDREQVAKEIIEMIDQYNRLNERTGKQLHAIFNGQELIVMKSETLQEIIDRI